jgi:hypothetical protein
VTVTNYRTQARAARSPIATPDGFSWDFPKAIIPADGWWVEAVGDDGQMHPHPIICWALTRTDIEPVVAEPRLKGRTDYRLCHPGVPEPAFYTQPASNGEGQ